MKEKEGLLGMLSNEEYALSWTCDELERLATRSSHPIVSDWSLVRRSGTIECSAYRRKSFPWKTR